MGVTTVDKVTPKAPFYNFWVMQKWSICVRLITVLQYNSAALEL